MIRPTDAVYATYRCAVAAARIAADRVLGRGQQVPVAATEMTTVWLEEALREQGSDASVEAIELLDGHSGTTSRRRIGVRYRGEAGGLPKSLFVKVAPARLGTAVFVDVFALGLNEVHFYRVLAHEVAVDVPRAFVARAHAGTGRFVVVMEDLAAAGVEFPSFTRPCSPQRAHSVVRAMARLHAPYWESARLNADLSWLPRFGRDRSYRVGRAISEAAVRPAMSRLARLDVTVPQQFLRRARAIHERRDLLERAWAVPPLTLIHGDAHVGNLYFRREAPGFLDWQLVRCAQAMRDVTHFTIGALSVEARRAAEKGLLAAYVAELADNGVKGFCEDDAMRLHRLHALYEWIGVCVTVAGGLQPPEVQRAAVERSIAAIEDLDSFELLDTLR